MIPKDKAIDLVDKFLQYTPVEFEHEYAKKCALIAVDEIINSVDDEHVSDIFKEHWQQVKQEIEKL
jgi:hypothetical protein